jgi:GNAT superfamily N-acetyltransferase
MAMIIAQEESWTQAITDMEPLLVEHYEELSLHTGLFPLSVSFHIYYEMEARGELLVVTLRDLGTLVGYFVGFVRPGLHYNTCLTLTMDVFFISPEARNKAAGAFKLFRHVERVARARGIDYMVFGSKKHKDSGRIFQAMKMAHIEDWYGKFLTKGTL